MEDAVGDGDIPSCVGSHGQGWEDEWRHGGREVETGKIGSGVLLGDRDTRGSVGVKR